MAKTCTSMQEAHKPANEAISNNQAAPHQQDARSDLAQEVPIVGHRNDGALKSLDRLLQHFFAGDVQVVGRLCKVMGIQKTHGLCASSSIQP
eukprot:1159241-Pelagomonas_calceolata.AAC.7